MSCWTKRSGGGDESGDGDDGLNEEDRSWRMVNRICNTSSRIYREEA